MCVSERERARKSRNVGMGYEKGDKKEKETENYGSYQRVFPVSHSYLTQMGFAFQNTCLISNTYPIHNLTHEWPIARHPDSRLQTSKSKREKDVAHASYFIVHMYVVCHISTPIMCNNITCTMEYSEHLS